MPPLVSLVGDVEEAIASGDTQRRVDVLRRIASLFLEQAPKLKDHHVAVFDEVILRLSRDIEFRARIDLADQFADLDNAPRLVVQDLAFDDDIAVAKAILERSSRLSEDDLVTIAAEKGQSHLLALSRRTTLTERVTDILVDRGNKRVVRSVAGNGGARFSPRGFTQLVEKARADQKLQDLLRARADIPPETLVRLVEIAREKVRETLAGELGGEAEGAIDAAVNDAASAMVQSPAARTLAGGEARARRENGWLGEVTEEWVVAALKAGRIEDALAGMAQLGKLPPDMVARAYHASNYDPLLFVVRSLRFGWNTFRLLLTQKAGRVPPDKVLKAAFEAFQRLTIPTAQKVVHFNMVRERARQAGPDTAPKASP